VNVRSAAIVLIALAVAGCAAIAPRERAVRPQIGPDGVTFRFYAPAATRVQLAGDWPGNNWARGDGSAGEADIGLMSDDDGDGVWEITVDLAPGRYLYIFWVNETMWRLDPANPEEVPGGPAGRASLLTLFSTPGESPASRE
jgi:1,4-alpha-glucan branching enzyme